MIINFFSKEILVSIIITLLSGYLLLIKIFVPKIITNFNKQWKDINNKLDTIEKNLLKNNSLALACLFNDLDSILRKAEITGIWSSTISEQWERMYRRYLDNGDGLDGGASLRKRADNIEINDAKYVENVSNYNKNKKAMIENYKD